VNNEFNKSNCKNEGTLNNKAFTLIELLAIIVILAIIAVITVPIILNIIDSSKKGAVKDSALGFKDAVQKYYVSKLSHDIEEQLPSGYVLVGLLPNDFEVSGDVPTEDSWVQLDRGNVISYSLKFGNYVVTKYSNSDVVVTKGNVEENEVTRAERLKLEAKAQVATIVSDYIISLSSDTTISGYTKDEGKKVSEITTTEVPTGMDENSWIYYEKSSNSITDYSIKVTVGDYSFVVNKEAGQDVSEPEYNGSIITPQKKPVSFSDDTWAEIKANLTANRHAYDNQIGQTKEVEIDGTSYTVRLSNTSACPNDWPSTASKTACGVVIEFVSLINEQKINNTKTNQGGWPATLIYSYLNDQDSTNELNSIYEKLPLDLRNIIIDTYVVSGHGNQSEAQNYTSIDKMYLLSFVEVYGEDNQSDSLKATHTRQLKYYENTYISDKVKKYNGDARGWLLRSADAKGDGFFMIVKYNGQSNFIQGAGTEFLAPAFRIMD